MTTAIAAKQPSRPRRWATVFPILGWLPKYERGLAAQRPHCRPYRHGAAGARGHGLCRAGRHAAPDYLLRRAGGFAALRHLRHLAPAGGRGLLRAGGHVLLDRIRPGAAGNVRVHRPFQCTGDYGRRRLRARRRAPSRPHRPVLLVLGAGGLCLGPGGGGGGQAAAQALWHRVRLRQRVGAPLRSADPPAGDAHVDAGRWRQHHRRHAADGALPASHPRRTRGHGVWHRGFRLLRPVRLRRPCRGRDPGGPGAAQAARHHGRPVAFA